MLAGDLSGVKDGKTAAEHEPYCLTSRTLINHPVLHSVHSTPQTVANWGSFLNTLYRTFQLQHVPL